MRGVLLAMAMMAAPVLAWAQTATPPAHASRPPHSASHSVTIAPPTDAQASGADTLAGESFSAPAITTDASPPAPPAPEPVAAADTQATQTATGAAPVGVAAPGINLSETIAPAAPATVAAAPPATHGSADAHSATARPPASGVAAPGINANASASHASATRTAIQPANDLERAFINAAHQASARTAFRHTFLTSQVALATTTAAANSPAREIRLGPGGDACLIFTSNARATQIMGAQAPRQLMTGREALERIRGAHLVIININMDPYLTLDAAGIEAFLAADTAPATPSAGPSQ
jgi:hypothetical protein